MKRVLIVDDEEDMLWMLQRNLSKSLPDTDVITATSGEQALEILSEKNAQLVISDINMPGMNGLDLLAEINDNYPETSVVIITAYPSSSYENEAMMSGCLRFIEKPFDVKDLQNTVAQILKQDDQFQGTIDGIDLMDIVQFNGLSGASAALKVTTFEEEGIIFFKSGHVVHAMCGDQTGEDAFYTILGFQGGTLQNIRGAETPVTTINKDLQTLLLKVVVNSDHDDEDEDLSISDNVSDIAALSSDLDSELAPALSPAMESPASLAPDEDAPAAASPASLSSPVAEAAPAESPASLSPADTDPAPLESPASFSPSPLTETEPNTYEETDMNMTEIQAILAEFTSIEGVHTACLVGRDGFLLDSIARKGIDAEMIGAIASSGFGSAESMGTQLGQGELRMTMLEYENGPVMFSPVGDDAFLVIVADQETNLGWIRISIKKNSKKIAEAAGL